MNSPSARFLTIFVLVPILAAAQSGGSSGSGGGSTGSTGGGSKGGGSTTTTSTTTVTPGRTNRPIPSVTDDQQRPIMLAGRVVMDDGTIPTERVSIERVCNGRARRETYTDSKGYFNITIDNRQPAMIMQDASVGADAMSPRGTMFGSTLGGMDSTSSPSLAGCELRAMLPGATSSSVQLAGHRAFDDPNVGTIVLRRLDKTHGATISLTSLQAPQGARKALEKGRKALEKNKTDEAKADFNKAVEEYPAFAEAWAELSDLYLKEKDFDNARMTSEKALAADSRYVRPYFTLIVLSVGKQDWKAVADYSDKLVALDANNYPAGFYYNSLAYFKLHDLQKADDSVQAARKLDPQFKLPKIALLRASILMERNDYAGAVQEYQSFLTHVSDGPDAKYARDALSVAQSKLAVAASTPK